MDVGRRTHSPTNGNSWVVPVIANTRWIAGPPGTMPDGDAVPPGFGREFKHEMQAGRIQEREPVEIDEEASNAVAAQLGDPIANSGHRGHVQPSDRVKVRGVAVDPDLAAEHIAEPIASAAFHAAHGVTGHHRRGPRHSSTHHTREALSAMFHATASASTMRSPHPEAGPRGLYDGRRAPASDTSMRTPRAWRSSVTQIGGSP
jgi:hypothetical protein